MPGRGMFFGNIGKGRRATGNTINFRVSLEGDKELIRKLKSLPDKVLKKVARPASRKAVKDIVKAAKRRVRPISKLIAKSIGVKQKTYAKSGIVFTVIGPRTGFQDPITGHDPANTAHLVEFGTDAHVITLKDEKRAGRGVALRNILSNINNPRTETVEVFGTIVSHPGTQPFPFIRPAIDERKSQTVSKYSRELGKGIDKEVVKMGKAK